MVYLVAGFVDLVFCWCVVDLAVYLIALVVSDIAAGCV